ncbi:MAG: hypothetical protein JRI25_09090 [Deltaproteobacteria bacterium]|nr:hypothetical protein [Deltaproteobacteria bacterium]MBW2254735.1 hypothetical protein [Deltaproteobacteria bacterium]
MRNTLLLASVAALTACGLEGGMAGESQLLVPEDLELHWDASFNRVDDGLAVLLPVDVMVYDGASGEPLDGVALELRGTVPGATLVFPEAVAVVGPEETEAVGLWWDAWRDRYFEFDVDESLEPSLLLQTETDATGLARVYVFVDSFPEDDLEFGGFAPASVTVSMGELDESFLLIPR